MSSERASQPEGSEGRLRREIGWVAATAIVVNSTVGTGIFQRPATVVREAGSLNAAALVWVVGATIALCGALSVAELSVRFPRAGGLYEPLRRAYGPRMAFVFGWAQVMLLAPSAIGGFCLLGGGALASFLGWPEGHEKPIAAALLAFTVLTTLRGTRASAIQQTAITTLKYAGVITLAVAGLFFSFEPGTAVSPDPSLSVRLTPSVPGFLAALIAAMWAYDGWADLASLGAEVRAPTQTLPRALIGGTLLVAFAYLAVVFGDARVLGLDGLRAAGSGADMAAMRVAERTAGEGGRRALSLLIAVSATGGALASVLTHSRAFLPMATDGTFFRSFGVVSERGVPQRAVLAMSVLAGLYLMSSTFEALTDAFVVGYFPFYALAVISVFRFRKDLPAEGFRMPLYPLPAVLFLVGATMVTVGALLRFDGTAALAFGMVGLGVLVSYAYQRWL